MPFVDVVSPAPRDTWREIVAADPNAVATQTPEWCDALCEARNAHDASRLYRLPDGRRLLLPLAARSVAGIRVSEESWSPDWGYGGILADGGPLTIDDIAYVVADLSRHPAWRIGLVPVPLLDARYDAAMPRAAQRIPYLSQVLDLEPGFGAVWSRSFKASTRQKVRRAERIGLDIHRDSSGTLVPAFADLYARSVDRWAAKKGQPLRAARYLARRRDRPGDLAVVAAHLRERCTVWLASLRGAPVAALVVLHHGRDSLAWLSAMDPELARVTGGTFLLQSLMIEDACAAGVRRLHLGESDPGSGVQRYKASFGAVTQPYRAYRLERLPVTPVQRRVRSELEQLIGRRSESRREFLTGAGPAPALRPVDQALNAAGRLGSWQSS